MPTIMFIVASFFTTLGLVSSNNTLQIIGMVWFVGALIVYKLENK